MISKFFFSTYKKKVHQVASFSVGAKSLNKLYTQLDHFESKLSYLEKLKYHHKAEDDFSKKYRRIFRAVHEIPSLPLKLTYTHEFFYKRHNQIIFGSQLQPKQPSLQELVSLTNEMVKNDLSTYHNALIHATCKHESFFTLIQERFQTIEEHFCGHIYKGYRLFAEDTQNLLLKKETKYKGDFKFNLNQEIDKIEMLATIAYNSALFNQCRQKISLAAELAIVHYSHQLTPDATRKLLFTLAINNKPIKAIEEQLDSIFQKLKDYPFQLLFYMAVAKIQNYGFFIKIQQNYIFSSKNICQTNVMKVLAKILYTKHQIVIKGIQIKSESAEEQKFEVKNEIFYDEGDKFFGQYLKRQEFIFERIYNPITNHGFYEIQGKKFMVRDHFLQKQDYSINGITLLIMEYFKNKNESSFKMINWPRMSVMEKRVEKDEYILSKFKGITKPIKKRVSKFQ